MRTYITITALGIAAACAACIPESTADQKERQATEAMASQAVSSVGMPAITRFAAKRTMKMVYELQDQQRPTTTYILNELTGKLYKFCDSLGYPIPYATQYTNPQRPFTRGGEGVTAITQPDPDGLFKPGSADGTWVVCIGPDKSAQAVYVEQKVTTSPFPLAQLEEVPAKK